MLWLQHESTSKSSDESAYGHARNVRWHLSTAPIAELLAFALVVAVEEAAPNPLLPIPLLFPLFDPTLP